MENTKEPNAALRAGELSGRMEEKALGLATNRIYRLHQRHPILFAIAAFLIGAFVVGLFTMISYSNWAYEGIDGTRAFWQLVGGSLIGGLAGLGLAFWYITEIRPTLRPMRKGGVIPPR